MSSPRKGTKHIESTDADKVTQAVFAAAESMGITDRAILEGFTEQVMQHLQSVKPLPGMEELFQHGRNLLCLPPGSRQ